MISISNSKRISESKDTSKLLIPSVVLVSKSALAPDIKRARLRNRDTRYVRVRELEEGNPTKVRSGPILRQPRGQFDTNGPWFDGVNPDRLDTRPAQHTSPNVCGRFSAPARRHRSATCL